MLSRFGKEAVEKKMAFNLFKRTLSKNKIFKNKFKSILNHRNSLFGVGIGEKTRNDFE